MLDMYFSQNQVCAGSNQVSLENVSHRDNFCPCKHIALQEELWIPLLHAAVVYLIQLNRIIPCELGESLKLFLFKKHQNSTCTSYRGFLLMPLLLGTNLKLLIRNKSK